MMDTFITYEDFRFGNSGLYDGHRGKEGKYEKELHDDDAACYSGNICWGRLRDVAVLFVDDDDGRFLVMMPEVSWIGRMTSGLSSPFQVWGRERFFVDTF